MSGPEGKKGPITFDEILVDDHRTDLALLGLDGLLGTLRASGLKDEKFYPEAVKTLSKAAFRGFAELMHPDKESASLFSEDSFQEISEAFKNVNADPKKVIAEQEIQSNGQSAEIKRKDAIIQALGKKYRENRRSTAENLYFMHYDKMFPREDNKPLTLTLRPYVLNLPRLEEERVLDRLFKVEVNGDELIYKGTHLVTGQDIEEEELRGDADQKDEDNNSPNLRGKENLILEADELAQYILPSLRIIGSIPNDDRNAARYPNTQEVIERMISTPEHLRISPLDYINSDPGSYNDIDQVNPVVRLEKYKDLRLIMARRDSKGNLLVGPFADIAAVD